jgi:hypothetical protein
MSVTNEASALHLQAADDHEAAATYHRKAADSHEQNKLTDARGSARGARECSDKAHKNSASACAVSEK